MNKYEYWVLSSLLVAVLVLLLMLAMTSCQVPLR